jgi:serine protease
MADLDGHGTHVSGTIAEAANNNFLVAGMAYNVQIMPVKVCNQYWDMMIARGVSNIPGLISTDDATCLFQDIADGIDYAVDHGARVLNISLGGDSPSNVLLGALQYAANHGAFVAVSMGNEGDQGNPIQYPAAYAPSIDGVMSVAAVNANSSHASYSSSGSYCEVAAPGGDIDNSRADFGAIWQSTLRPSTVDPNRGVRIPRFDSYDKVGYTGTSMAAPHVSALAALLMSQQPKLTGAQVEQIIKNAVKDLGAAGKDNLYGYGLIQPREALYGHGILR